MMTDFETDELEDFFAAARATPTPMPADLQARILADAAEHMPGARSSWQKALWHLLGGATGLGGLVTATAVGIWLGVAPPSGLPDLAGQVVAGPLGLTTQSDTETETLAGVYGWDMEES